MAVIKFSILYFYYMAFSSRIFHRCLILVGTFTVLWLVVSIIVTNIQRIPPQYMWNLSRDEVKRLHFDIFTIAMTGLNVVGSLVLLALPVSMVLRLNPSQRKQMLLIASFVLGGA